MTGHILLPLFLLWLAGNALRLPVLAVPPVLPNLQAELGMSGTEIGILSGLPVVLFAVAALPGSLLIARIGALQALIAGLLLAAVGTALRGGVWSVETLYAATFVMGIGIAVMQPALPAIVRQWMPDRVGFTTAVYTNGLIVGEIIPVAAMPLVLPLLGGSWRAALAVWAIPLVAIALLVALGRPKRGHASQMAERPSWWPDWDDGMTWKFGLIMGSVNAAYFSANAFLPGHLAHAGRPDLIAAALTGLNLGQLPASVLLLVLASRLERRIWPMVAAGVCGIVCTLGIVATSSLWTVAFATALGFFAGGTLALSLALPPLLKAPGAVAATSAAMFTIGYAQAVVTSVLGGAAWDLAGMPVAAFMPIIAGLLLLIVLPFTLRPRLAALPARA
jgi:CP family cyanate transporter-like MFS transporter